MKPTRETRMKRAALFAAWLLAAPLAWADCETRTPTAQEQKAFADGHALFQKLAPPAPEGWSASDWPKDGTLSGVCADTPETRGHFEYRRQLERRYGTAPHAEDQREADAAYQRQQAVADRMLATRETNAAKIAAVDAEIEALKAKFPSVAGDQAGMQSLMQQMQELNEQKMQLMGLGEMAAMEEASRQGAAAMSRDSRALFQLDTSRPGLDTGGYEAVTLAAGKGYRKQTQDDRGNPEVELLIVLGPGAQGGQDVVTLRGAPSRVEALLKSMGAP